MISFLLFVWIMKIDKGVSSEIGVNYAFAMAFTELIMFLLYINFGLKCMDAGQFVVMLLAFQFAIYANFTAYMDLFTGYVYKIVNLISLGCILIFSIKFIGLSPGFTIFFLVFTGIVFLCEKMGAFYRGDTEFLIVLYLFFAGVGSDEFAISNMFVTMLVSAFLFDVFRRITGRKEEILPYTPFIVLSEIINLFVLCCI